MEGKAGQAMGEACLRPEGQDCMQNFGQTAQDPNQCTPPLPPSPVAVVAAAAASTDVAAADIAVDRLCPGFILCWGAGTKM